MRPIVPDPRGVRAVARAVRARAGALLAATLLAGCTLVELDRQVDALYASAVLVGRIDAPSGITGPLVVAAWHREGGLVRIAAHTMQHEPGGYELMVPRGAHALFAFADRNANGVYDAGEPVGAYNLGRPVAASGSDVVTPLDIALTDSLPARTDVPPPGTGVGIASHARRSTQVGALADLDDPLFSADGGREAYWEPLAFFERLGGNVHFVEPYDPARIPVLLVHGAAGSPQDWRGLIARLDRRYQPWLFYYPSGASLDSMAYLLQWKLRNLQLRYRFQTLHLIAHSMGGLVVRRFLLDHGALFPQIRLFVSLSTPWGGEATAALGVHHSPAVVPSWRDMQPDGRFLRELFARKLPPQVDHYLLFGHRGGLNLLQPNNDGTVTLASQLHTSAQAEARQIFGFDVDHVGILSAPQVYAKIDGILASAEQRSGEGPQGGHVVPDFTYVGTPAGPTPLPILMLDPVPDEPGSVRAAPMLLPLTLADAGRRFGPLPPGDYDASVIAPAHRAEPRRARVRIEPGGSIVLRTELHPQGALFGYVGADDPPGGSPPGSRRAPHATIRITSIVLRGPGVQRMLRPRPASDADPLRRYVDGEDHAQQAQFSFVGLPEGRHELRIEAQGYQPHVSVHHVVPGREAPVAPIVMVPAR